jgi:hypothetical protein
MRAERTQVSKFNLTNHDLNCDAAQDVFKATRPELTVPNAYKAYAPVFLEMDLKSMPNYGNQRLAIELFGSKQQSWSPI